MGVEDVIHFISEGVREKVKEAKAEQKKETTEETAGTSTPSRVVWMDDGRLDGINTPHGKGE